MREHDYKMTYDPQYRQNVMDNLHFRDQTAKDRYLRKRLRQWIKQENLDVPEDIKKMIGYLK